MIDTLLKKKKKKLFKESKQKDRNEIRYKVFFVCLFVCLFFKKNFKQGTLVLTPVHMYIDFFFLKKHPYDERFSNYVKKGWLCPVGGDSAS